jgi:hypothetical protein
MPLEEKPFRSETESAAQPTEIRGVSLDLLIPRGKRKSAFQD